MENILKIHRDAEMENDFKKIHRDAEMENILINPLGC